MKLYSLILAMAFFTIGCSSNDDNPPSGGTSTTTGAGMTAGEACEDTISGEVTIINICNYEAMLADVLFYANAEYTNEILEITQLFFDQNGFGDRRESSSDFTFTGSDVDADPVAMMSTETRNFDCNLGGTFSTIVSTSSSSGISSVGELVDCATGKGNINGGFNSNGFSGVDYSNIRIKSFIDDTENAVAQADAFSYFLRASDVQQGRAWSIETTNASYNGYHENGVDYIATVGSAKLTLSESIADAQLSTYIELSYSSIVTKEQNVTLSTVSPMKTFSDGSEPYYSSGQFNIVASDGSSMDVNADNGDISTFTATVTASGTNTAFIVPWSDERRIRIRCFNAESRQPLTRFTCN